MTSPSNARDQRNEDSLTPRHQALLEIIHTFLPDQTKVNSLKAALAQEEPLDLIRVLAQQWNMGLSTLEVEQDHQHESFVTVAVAAKFIKAIDNVVTSEVSLNVEQSPASLREAIGEHIKKNRPVHAAWCAARLWEQDSLLK